MQNKMLDLAKELRAQPSTHTEHTEAASLLEWMTQQRLVFLGYAEFDLKGKNQHKRLNILQDSTLGLCREEASGKAYALDQLVPHNSLSYVNSEEVLSLTKTSARAPLHRADHLDLITIPRYNKEHKIEGKHCFIGLFTSMVYNTNASDIPWLGSKISKVLSLSNKKPGSHAARALQNILDTYPRDTLFQADEETILDTALAILQLHDRSNIRLLGRMDKYAQFCDCLVYIPREIYHRDLRIKIQHILTENLDGQSVEFNIQFSSESTLARLHYTIQLKQGHSDQPDWKKLEKLIVAAAHSWDDGLQEALREYFGEERGNCLYKKYQGGIPSNYKEDFSPRNACIDIEHIENLSEENDPGISFYRPIITTERQIKSKIFTDGDYIALSDVIPVIENMGLKVDHERPYEIIQKSGNSVWIHEFTAHHAGGLEIDPDLSGEKFKQAFLKIWKGDIEDDGFNRLVIDANLNWQQTTILRSYSKYLLQIRAPFSQAYMIESLVKNASITHNIVALFELLFDPSKQKNANIKSKKLIEEMDAQLQDVSSLDEDRILRAFINLMQATMRTNFYRTDSNGQALPYLSFKIKSAEVNDMPLPRSLFDIFVYSPRVEGVHLRGGKVARGGLRWSDRREDFRTEVLGLMKAQMVKNAVIVPVGSKGGFFVKQPPANASREELMDEVVYCYKTFLRGLLDLTDNLEGDKVLPPPNVVRYDENDPYLVVAADKGTATFSDIANGVAAEYNYWLGDAFASGGSVGYDHKKMGITARGAWESVKRHFRELNHNTQTEDFTVVGIGDMGGDVFGNGMLLSQHIQLVAAFNHLHIFIDPTPNSATSFEERKRLFELPRSSWEDYNQSLVSAGGGLFSRSAKTINLSDEARKALSIEATHLTPNDLIHHILQAPVDLLWNGGIGTYVKASKENHEDASDRANDVLRVDANQLRCKVIGEGGNLGFTQLSRIEFSQNNGSNYTDAVDNSAGVDCSDHEVNIKILVDQMVQAGDMTGKQRNKLLADMTDEVGDMVLVDNYLQTQCISLTSSQAPALLEEHSRFMSHLESQDLLNRHIEYLPDHETIADRLADQKGLVRPEIAVLVSYAKMTMFDALMQSSLPDDPYLEKRLHGYFPTRLSQHYAPAINAHRLRREIIATQLVNDLVNRLGPSFAFRLEDEIGATTVEVCKAFDIVSNVFRMNDIWHDIESLDNTVPDTVQQDMHILVRGLVERTMHWLLRSRRCDLPIEELVHYFKPAIDELIQSLPKSLASINAQTYNARVDHYVDKGVSKSLAARAAKVVPLSSSLDIVEISKTLEQDVAKVAAIYFELGIHLDLQWLRDQIADLSVRNRWHTLAKSSLRSDLHYQQRHLTAEVIKYAKPSKSITSMVEQWAGSSPAIEQYSTLITELKASPSIDFAMLSLAVNEVHKLLQSDRPLDNG
jgi:glutamate dehydrogenase